VCVQEYCLKFIVKESNFVTIISTKEFETIDQSLMVEIIRRKTVPSHHRTVQDVPLDVLRSKSLLLHDFRCLLLWCIAYGTVEFV
jgi:hypothetical protein